MTHKLQVHRIHGHLHTFTIDSIDSCLPNCPESRICMTFPRSCSCWIWVQLLRNCNGGAALWRHGLSHEACLKVLIVLAPNITESPTILPNIQASSNVIAKASLQLTPLCLGSKLHWSWWIRRLQWLRAWPTTATALRKENSVQAWKKERVKKEKIYQQRPQIAMKETQALKMHLAG